MPAPGSGSGSGGGSALSSAAIVTFGNQFSRLAQSVHSATKAIVDFNSNITKESFAKIDYLKEVRDKFGGFTYDSVIAKQSIEGLAGYALQSNIDLLEVAGGSKDSIIQFNKSLLDGKKAFMEFFKDPKEAANLFNETMTDIINQTPNLIKSLQAGDNQRIAFYRKTLNIGSEETTKLLQKQYAFTGKASSEILGDIASISDSLAKKTGQAAKDLKTDIIKITTDIDRFGDIGVDSAGRISAALNQLGMTTESYTGILDKFMNFDTAAENVGKISQLFGVQMDAMEMTYLANEDQEEFLYRLREQLLDTGVDIDNMSNARLKQMASAVNLNVTQFKTLMREGEMAFDQFDLEDATDENLSKTQADKLTIAAEKFGDKYQGALRDSKDRMEALEQQHIGKLTPAILATAEAARKVAKEYNKIKIDPQLINITEQITAQLNLDYSQKMSNNAQTIVTKYNDIQNEMIKNSSVYAREIGTIWNTGMKFVTDATELGLNTIITVANNLLPNTTISSLSTGSLDASINTSNLANRVNNKAPAWNASVPLSAGNQSQSNTQNTTTTNSSSNLLNSVMTSFQTTQNQQQLFLQNLTNAVNAINTRPISVALLLDGKIITTNVVNNITSGQNQGNNNTQISLQSSN